MTSGHAHGELSDVVTPGSLATLACCLLAGLFPASAARAHTLSDPALLYAVIGDLSHNGQLQNNAVRAIPDDTGVSLRVRQDGTSAPGNPSTPCCSGLMTHTCVRNAARGGNGPCVLKAAKYYTYGVRGCFGLAIDPPNGSFWDTENGPTRYAEVNHVAAGCNSGWAKLMGPDARDPQGLGDLWNLPGAGSTYSDPEFSWLGAVVPTAIVLRVGSGLGSNDDNKVLVAEYNSASCSRSR